MLKNKLLLLLALLMTAATGAWAQSTIHVVKQDNVNTIFSGDGYTLGDAVAAGDVLDFQGTIELEGDASHSLVINKAVTVKSSTKDAVLKLHTPAGDRTAKIPAAPSSSTRTVRALRCRTSGWRTPACGSSTRAT